jgi:hypothetical protein
MPEGLPAQFWDTQSGQVNMGEFVKSYGELSTFKAGHDERLTTLPKTADDYKLDYKLPDTVKMPDGMELKIDPKDPLAVAARSFAHKHKMSQAEFSELVTLHAQTMVEAHTANEAAIQAEMKKLGENGPARVKAAEDFLKTAVSADEFAAIKLFIGDATAFAGLEKLIAKATTQKVPGNGDPPPTQRPAEKRTADLFYGDRKAS